jgi:hypothetical protein
MNPIDRARPTRSLFFLARWCLVLCAVGLWCRPARAQADAQGRDFSAAEEGWQGLSEFVRLAAEQLGPDRLRVVAEIDFSSLAPHDALIVLYPEVDLDGRALTAFLAAGGRLALLDDFGRAGPFLQTFGIERVPAPPDARFSLRGDPDLAIATPYEETVAGARVGRHPMLEGIEQVVTNHPRALEHPDLTPVLGIERNDGSLVPILVTGVIAGRGRLVAGSDPSMFINLMLRYPGNRRLVRGLLSYLTDREDAAAALPVGRVFLATGGFTMTGSYGGKEDALQGLRREFERLKRNVREAFQDGIPEMAWLLAAALLGVLVVGREFRQLRLRGTFAQPRYAREVPVLAQAGTWARAEVLAAPSTTPLLSLIELETALSESLQHRLGVSPTQSIAALRTALTARGLDTGSADRLVGLLLELRRLGQSLASRRPKRPSSASVKRLHDLGMHLLHAIERLGDKA